MQTIDKRIRAGLVLFWALYFSVVLLSNSADALKALSVLAADWPFVSGNYTLIRRVVGVYGSPGWLAGILFGGVIVWQCVGMILFWRAFLAVSRQTLTQHGRVHQAFGVTIGLWAAFILADEVFLAYRVGDVSATHFSLLIAELVTLILIQRLE